MKATLLASLFATGTLVPTLSSLPILVGQASQPVDWVEAFRAQGLRLTEAEAQAIAADVRLALEDGRRFGAGHSRVGFAAVQIARTLGLDTSEGSPAVAHVQAVLRRLIVAPPQPNRDWDAYYDQTLALGQDRGFLSLLGERGYHPVKISWEDIGRYEGSVWGDRISDVGIWVRRREDDPTSARLALSVRRDSNFRDKVLLVPSERIKVHVRRGGRLEERTLPQRLQELGLACPGRDRHVIVSNQFAIVPVPGHDMRGASPVGKPPRAAFTFSIYPYGSSNYVITDVIEGSHEAVVGPGGHQLLFANDHGRKAPFTASRAADRPDLQRLESDLKARGMDVDVQRYYLIQIPLRRDVPGLRTSAMGEPPMGRVMPMAGGLAMCCPPPMPKPTGEVYKQRMADAAQPGLDKVAIGTGEAEGAYAGGEGYRGARAEEPIRVTVVTFVTPVGKVTRRDMETFRQAFEAWDAQAIWGGSFVVKQP